MSHQPDNIFAGTQVVALVEIRDPNKALVHPRGAVGVVTRTPTGNGEHFLVRFPDGFEKSLTRAQLEVLKHFKDRLGPSGAGVSPAGSAGVSPAEGLCGARFELEEFIIYRCIMARRSIPIAAPCQHRRNALAPRSLHVWVWLAGENVPEEPDIRDMADLRT
jgi:uncharacterized protein